MVVTQWDNINVQCVMDIVASKAIRAVLQEATGAQCYRAAQKLRMDGHPLTADDVETVCKQFIVSLRRLAENTLEKGQTIPAEPEVTKKPN